MLGKAFWAALIALSALFFLKGKYSLAKAGWAGFRKIGLGVDAGTDGLLAVGFGGAVGVGTEAVVLGGATGGVVGKVLRVLMAWGDVAGAVGL